MPKLAPASNVRVFVVFSFNCSQPPLQSIQRAAHSLSTFI